MLTFWTNHTFRSMEFIVFQQRWGTLNLCCSFSTLSPVYIRASCWFIWQVKGLRWHVAVRPSVCLTVFVRNTRGAAVEAGKAKICELERERFTLRNRKGAMELFIFGKRVSRQWQEVSHLSYQHSGCVCRVQSFHFLFYFNFFFPTHR